MKRLPFILFVLLSFSLQGFSQTEIKSGVQKRSTPDRPQPPEFLPVPQQTILSGKNFALDAGWKIEVTASDPHNIALDFLQSELQEKYGLMLPLAGTPGVARSAAKTIRLIVRQGLVSIPPTVDTDRVSLLRQAYDINLKEDQIVISANANQGLFYGVQTLLQSISVRGKDVLYPEGHLKDWPDLALRMIYWDDAHHLEKLDVLKREIRQASLFKINAFAIKLEGHFQFSQAAPVVEPYALSPQQFQDLTDYAAKYFVALVPFLDAPAHVSFILKHPEYKDLRAFPNSNYQFTVNNPGTYELVLSMFRELIAANKGVDYILLSNDEAYYTGKAANEIDSARVLGGTGKLLARFIGRMADSLKQCGRKVIFWGEYPLVPDDIRTLPAHLINGVYDSSWAPLFKERGIRQFIYTSTQGEEPLFPNYYSLSPGDVLHSQNGTLSARVPEMLTTISGAIKDNKSDLAGVIVAGWADAGLHPQTFWLGYATGAAMGWNHSGGNAETLSNGFYTQFFGAETEAIKRIYNLTSRQAQFYEDSWEWYPSNQRTPIFGNHAEVYSVPRPAMDQRIPELPVPDSENLKLPFNWTDSNSSRLRLAEMFLKESDELSKLLDKTGMVRSNQYNLEVIRSVAAICRQNLRMLQELKQINNLLNTASGSAGTNPLKAVRYMDEALDLAMTIKEKRNAAFSATETTWYQDWLPLVDSANGRKYLRIVDDVKDHRPMRTTDLSYNIYRELQFPFDDWAARVLTVRNAFAERNKLSTRNFRLDWKNYR